MKKLSILIAVFVVSFSSTIIAQGSQTAPAIEEAVIEVAQEKYTKVATDQVSNVVKAAVEKDFEGATIKEAFQDEEGNFKLVLVIGEETKTVYANKNGEWFNPNSK
ncbi:hypothetical protein ACFSTE_00840 [Aquimarina hainanensis]|uniref:Beta-lactamase-inhibitor-like PepSY-like domain-containing protein n=1 Tax=Aquimarina hainanensis TaxID=1578017 RepID=A0ABW5N150_9FLAO|nr:hypothetical protein [Aquimarina sp. TRL1]QKX04530.1 hypothetical protein HN014_06245 [Aquimarina sp. TRL1]